MEAELIQEWKSSGNSKAGEKTVQDLRGSTMHLKASKKAVEETEEPTTAREIYSNYKELVRDPRSFKHFRTYLRELKQIGVTYDIDGYVLHSKGGGGKGVRSKVKETHKEVLNGLIPSNTCIKMTDIYPQYVEKVPDPKGKRAVRNYMSELVEQGEIQKRGTGTGTSYTSLAVDKNFSAISIYVQDESLEQIQERAESNSRTLQEEFNEVLRKGLKA